jgi:ABC-2 type transport system ATP-binding protein
MINARSLSKTYGNLAALTAVDLTLARGRCLGLVGTNGAGRSTLLKILATQLKPTTGKVEIDGIDIIKHPFRARPKIGYLPQSPTFYDCMTVGEFLKFVISCRSEKTAPEGITLEAGRVFDGLDTEAPLRSLSHGLRQKLAITAALIPAPLLLLFDEPLSHLDPIATSQFQQTIKGFCARGGTVVMACNRIAEAAAMCDELAFVHQGRILETIRTDDPAADPAEIFRRSVGAVGKQTQLRHE